MSVKLHDLVIRTIAEFIDDKWCDNRDLGNLIRLNKRFYAIRDMFYKLCKLNHYSSKYAYHNRPYNWNKVRQMMLFSDGMTAFDFSELGSLHTLYIQNDRVIDVSALGRVYFLTLHHCKALRNLTGLGKNHTVQLLNLPKIRDLSPLSNIHTLYLNLCHNITDVSSLRSLHTLTISNCHRVSDVSALSNVKRLTLDSLIYVTDVAALKTVRILTIRRCHGIIDISALKDVYSLTVESCSCVNDYTTKNAK